MSLPSTAPISTSHADPERPSWSVGSAPKPSAPFPNPTATDPAPHSLYDRFTASMTSSPVGSPPASRTGSLARRRSSRAVHAMGATEGNLEFPISPRAYVPNGTAIRAARSTDRSNWDRSPSPPLRAPVPGAMAEAMNASKSPGLIRRFSRGASQKLRRRASNQQSLRMRDQSAGPVLIRRRSDSAGASDRYPDVSDLELDPSAEDAVDELPYLPGQKINGTAGLGRTSNASSYFEGGIAPATSAILQNGTWVYKLTTKKQKRLYIWLDPNAARVLWHPTNPAKSFFIDDVREVRVGRESRNMRDDIKIPEEKEHLVVSLVCDMPQRSKGASIKTMHFLMPDHFVLDQWMDALSTVTRERIEIMNALSASTEKSDRSMAMAWKLRKGPNADQFFTLDDAKWMCRMLEINCSDSAVRTHFTMCDQYNTGKLSYAQYKNFINSFKERKDIQNLYRNIKFGTDLDLDADSFFEFLRIEQGANLEKDRAHWEGVFERFARPAPKQPVGQDPDSAVKAPRTMSMQGFQNFLTSSANSPLAPGKAEMTFDRPLNEYFISSSHNTYLLGRQVRGTTSVEAYIGALIKGCRCVEIDCWDGDDGRPMVTHGRTMTTEVPFEDCVSVVAKYAFHTSPLPLVISLEVHCSPDQQRKMVALMCKYFDGMMVTEPLSSDAHTLPSPDDLRKRILVKVKSAEDADGVPLFAESAGGRSRARSVGSAITSNPFMDKDVPAMPAFNSGLPPTSPSETTVGSISTPRGSITSGPTNTPTTSSSDTDEPTVSHDKTKRRKTSKIIPELGRLGVYTQGIRYTGFNAPEAKTIKHIFSFNESTFSKLCTKRTDTKVLLEKHNQRFLMRVYPAAKRYDSSNFDPLQAWRRGVQMAALNWQTYDAYQQLNTAMFAAGPSHMGYVLKPEELRHAKHLPITDTLPGAPEKKERKGKKLVKFTVDVISAQRLPRPKTLGSSSSSAQEVGMNPYIVFEMYSAEDKSPDVARGEGGADASRNQGNSSGSIGTPLRKRTKIVEGNGFDPIWNESISMTVLTKYPGLIFVRWAVHNSPEARSNASTNSGPLAVFAAKLDTLQQGYRHLPLFNDYGEQYRDAKLFVRIRKEAAVPLVHQQDDHTRVCSSMESQLVGGAAASSSVAAGAVNGGAMATGAATATSPPPNGSFATSASGNCAAAGVSSAAASPRPEPIRAERSWRSRVFSRNPSQRRINKEQAASAAATSPMPAANAVALASSGTTTPTTSTPTPTPTPSIGAAAPSTTAATAISSTAVSSAAASFTSTATSESTAATSFSSSGRGTSTSTAAAVEDEGSISRGISRANSWEPDGR